MSNPWNMKVGGYIRHVHHGERWFRIAAIEIVWDQKVLDVLVRPDDPEWEHSGLAMMYYHITDYRDAWNPPWDAPLVGEQAAVLRAVVGDESTERGVALDLAELTRVAQ